MLSKVQTMDLRKQISPVCLFLISVDSFDRFLLV